MEYQEERRVFQVGVGEVSHSLDFGDSTGAPNLQIHQSQNVPPEAPRVFVGSMIDGVVTFSPQMGSHPLSQPIHHTIVAHQPQHPQLQNQPDQMNQQHQRSQQNQVIQTHLHSMSSTHNSAPPKDIQKDRIQSFNIINSCNDSDIDTESNNSFSDYFKSRWCLICNKGLPHADATEVIDSSSATLSGTGRKLSTLLRRVTNLALKSLHSRVLCQRCFSLLDEVDILELKLQDIKTEILTHFRSTLNIRQPEINLYVDYNRIEFGDDPSEESSEESSFEDDPLDLDVTMATLRGSSKSKKKLKKNNLLRKISKIANKEYKCEVRGSKQKKRRGRPRKEEKEEEDYIPPGKPVKDCPCCKKLVLAQKYLKHLLSHRMFPCPFCLIVFKRKDVKNHIAELHQEEVRYPCTECKEVYDSFSDLRKHCLLIHVGITEEREQCDICSKSFSTANALKVHSRTFHSEAELFECSICKETFNQKGNMQNHIRRIHFAQKSKSHKLSCSTCGKGFICSSHLKKHVERVHLKVRKYEVSCHVCSKTFSDSRAMKIHINAIHTKEIQYPCPDCKIIFYSRTNMITHQKRIHSGNDVRKYNCSQCEKSFCSPSDLGTHVRVVHENLRRFVCDICGQRFKVGSHLKYHRRKHTGETPYKCPHCPKCFVGPSHISDHVKKVHKTVYLGMNQRRKLNLPEGAPPPPPGIIIPKSKTKTVLVENAIETMPTRVIIQPPNPNDQPMMGNVTTITMQQHLPQHTAMHLGQPNYMIQPSPAVVDPHTVIQNSYSSNVQFDQTNNQSPLPMVVRLLHEMQY